MYIPGPPLYPLVHFGDIDSYLQDLEQLKPLAGGVGVYGPAADYALVWELGSLRQHPGPKTVWGVNRDGQPRIMSSQAPYGYVGVVSDKFWPIIEQAIESVDFSKPNLQLRLEVALENASQKIARLVRDNAPVDSGDLRAGIQPLDTGEALSLASSIKLESVGTLIV